MVRSNHSTRQHSTTGWSDHRAFHPSTRYHRVVRSSCIPPVYTVPQCGQIIVHSTHRHSTTGWSEHRAFHPSTRYHSVVRSSCIPPINTVPQGGQVKPFHPSTQYHRVVRSNHSTHQHGTTGWSDGESVRKEVGCRAQCRAVCGVRRSGLISQLILQQPSPDSSPISKQLMSLH